MMEGNTRYDTVLPWPECLGTFDEESCRFFLRELGRRVVQFYPFSVGMDDVFSLIVDEYGFEGAPDAMSVLQELLEDEGTATGIGDDGDIWRSWRHAWRHRNDDVHNPYVPRVRGRILSQPTAARIRLLKAANFMTLQLARAKHDHHPGSRYSVAGLPSVTETESLASDLGKNVVAHIRPVVHDYHRVLLNQIGRQEATIKRSKHSLGGSSVSSQPSEEHGLLPVNWFPYNTGNSSTGSPRRSLPIPFRKHTFPFNLTSPRTKTLADSTKELVVHDEHGFMPAVITALGDRQPVDGIEESSSKSKSPATSIVDIGTNAMLERTPLTQRLFRMQDNRYSLPSDLGSTDNEATPNRKRAVHREARMIDGALFHGKTRKENVIASENRRQQSPGEPLFASKRSSYQSTQQQSSRASWLHNAWIRLGKYSRNSKQPKLRKRHSSLGDCGLGSKQNDNRSASQRDCPSPIPEMQQVDPRSGQGLDGTFDERGRKPLPLSPVDVSARPSLQSDVERTFFADLSQPESFNYNPSMGSSGITRIREQDELRSLVSATMSGPQELSPKDKNFWNRYSSSTSQSAPSSPKTFTTFAAKNPYRDSSEPPITSAAHPAPLTLTYHKNEVSSTVWPFRASDNTMFEKDAIEESCDTRAYGSAQRGGSTPQKPHISIEDGQRGRKPLTPPSSPSRSRFNIQRPSPPKTPRPRSRSPVKRLMGMVKSMSTNQIPTDLSPSPTTAPSSTNKRRWKELGHKLKHGFLTPDLEQLEQEELMEQYATDNRFDAVRIITPPSTHERSAFPVSIKSSGQSKLWSELEYMLIETCNSFLKDEFDHNRLQRDSVLRIKRQWQARNRPQVIEFYYDQTTQYELVIANLRTVKLYSDYAQDAIILNSVLHQWKILIRELSVKTLCMPDSIVRRWLHDGRRVLELLGALPITLTNMDKLTSLCMAVIGSAEKERARRRVREEVGNAQGNHRRSVSDGSQTTLLKHEAALLNGADGPPPLPGSSSGSSGTTSDSRKVTLQELQRHLVQHAQQRKAAVAQGQTQGQISQGRTPHEAKQFIFTQGNGNSFGYTRGYKHGHGHSKSLEPGEERARFMYD